MSIHPVQSFKEMSTGKKVATVAAGAAVIAGVASGIAAYVKGKGVDVDTYTKSFQKEGKEIKFAKKGGLKFHQKLRAGYSEMFGKVKEFFSKFGKKAQQEAPEVVAE